jgi:hypothetical protein
VKITFSGGSDDVVTVQTGRDVEEYYTYEKGPLMWRAHVSGPDPDDVVVVTALMSEGGCWNFAAGQDADDFPLPDWPITIRQDPHTRYSALLEIDAPDGAKVTNIWPKGGDSSA